MNRSASAPEPAAEAPGETARGPGQEPPGERRPLDWRMPVLGAAAWVGGLVALPGAGWFRIALAVLAVAAVGWVWRRGQTRMLLAGALLAAAVASSVVVRGTQVERSWLHELADQQATVRVEVRVTSDPVVRQGRFGAYAFYRGRVLQTLGRGRVSGTDVPVLVIADPEEAEVALGQRIAFSARAGPADDPQLAAVLSAYGVPQVRGTPDLWWRGAAAVREGIARSVGGADPEERSLVPSLVCGDDRGMPEEMAEEFRTTGLTHLLAVSGTNLTLIVGFLLVVLRTLGVGGRWLLAAGALGIVGFVLLARTEPSVVRAAAMGAVALAGMGSNGRQRGIRGLGVAVTILLLLDPWLAASAGFALSVLATAGILFLAPPCRDAMARWLPRWAAEAIAVPFAAQLACTPVVAAISGQVSLSAVLANLLVAPAVGPATVLGIAGGLVTLGWPALGALVALPAVWCARWITAVAHWASGLPTPQVGWSTGPVAMVALTLVCAAIAVLAPRLLRHRSTGVVCVAALVLASVVRLPTPGWPPAGWDLVMCDVGQGDGLVLSSGPGRAVVVDAGPDPEAITRCLRRLEVERVDLLVLSHFHADHVDGAAALLQAYPVGQVWTSPLAAPAAQADEVARAAAAVGVETSAPSAGTEVAVGAVGLRVLGPLDRPPASETARLADDPEGSAINNTSLVLRAEVDGLAVLLTGDAEPEEQQALARAEPGIDVDVLKVPHHGSGSQDLPFLLGATPALAVVSVGADNTYGHPSPDVLVPLEEAGVEVVRTDLSGDVAVIADGGGLRVREAR